MGWHYPALSRWSQAAKTPVNNSSPAPGGGGGHVTRDTNIKAYNCAISPSISPHIISHL